MYKKYFYSLQYDHIKSCSLFILTIFFQFFSESFALLCFLLDFKLTYDVFCIRKATNLKQSLTIFSKQSLLVCLLILLPHPCIILSQRDFINVESIASLHNLSQGMFLTVGWFLMNCLNRISTTSSSFTKSSHGVTRPPRLRASMYAFSKPELIICSKII